MNDNTELSGKLIYTVSEVSKLFGVNKNRIYNLINAGLLKTIKFGRIKITSDSLENFLSIYDGYDLSDLDNIQINKHGLNKFDVTTTSNN